MEVHSFAYLKLQYDPDFSTKRSLHPNPKTLSKNHQKFTENGFMGFNIVNWEWETDRIRGSAAEWEWDKFRVGLSAQAQWTVL